MQAEREPCNHLRAMAGSCLQARLGEEYDRCANYLTSSTRRPLVAVVEKQLVAEHLGQILERGFTKVSRLGDGGKVGESGKVQEACVCVCVHCEINKWQDSMEKLVHCIQRMVPCSVTQSTDSISVPELQCGWARLA